MKKLIIIFILLCLLKGDEMMGFYENINIVENPNDIDVLVNKNNKLDKNYVPYDLEKISILYSNDDKYLRKEAKDAFENLSMDAKRKGYRVIATSTYRSYDYQEKLYNHYVEEYGLEYADNCSARKGHSEHQTGLAVDVEGTDSDYNDFEDTKDFIWMKDNAHKYGFILRYPKDKTHITGFKYEPWHYRYVGIEIATYMYEHNLCLEEYKKISN